METTLIIASIFGIILGLWGLAAWWGSFIFSLMGILPAVFFFGGIMKLLNINIKENLKMKGKSMIHEEIEEKQGILQADNSITGRTCPYCQTPIKPGIPVVTCPACQIPHHKECWEESNGCTTYGCKYVNRGLKV